MMCSSQKHVDEADQIARAALQLAAERGWAEIGAREVSRRAGVSLERFFDLISSRGDLLARMCALFDDDVAAAFPEGSWGEGTSARDRLFDVMMERYDLLNAHRAAIQSILAATRRDPGLAASMLPGLGRSMARMLAVAGLDASGSKGTLRAAGLLAVHLSVLTVWKTDDSPDLSKTMAALDRALGRADRWADRLGV